MSTAALWHRTPVGKSLEPGIRKTVSGWQVWLRRDGQMRSKHFPKGADLSDLRRWRERQIGLRMAHADAPLETGTLQQDVRVYLELIQGLVTYQNRVGWMREWVKALGPTTPRGTVTAYDIKRVLERWRRKGLSPATLNLRLAALQNLYRLLDGKGHNPTKEVTPYRVPFLGYQLPSFEDAVTAVEAIPTLRNRHRLRVFLWTGLPPSQIQRMTASRIQAAPPAMTVPGRRKGKGTRLVTLPLLPEALTAWQTYFAAGADCGPWNNSTLGRALDKGCQLAKVQRFRVYDLRHIFGTMIATIVKDDRAVAALLQHQTQQMTQRYTVNSVAPRVQEAIDAVKARR
jgi:integrase